MSIKRAGPFAALALAIAFATPASAAVIGGTFAGVATSGSFFATGVIGPVDVTGSAVTGAFSVSSVAGAVAIYGGGLPGAYALPGGTVTYSFTVASINQTYSFSSPSGGLSAGIDLTDNGTMQSVLLLAYANDPHLATEIILNGPEGSLFTNTGDIGSLHTGPGVSLQSPSFFGVFLTGGATVAINSQTFTSQAVPEPPAWTMLAASLAALAAVGLTRRPRAPH